MDKAIVLLSAGLDSTVNLYAAAKELQVESALTFNYGQRSNQKEIEFAKKSCDHLGIKHLVLDLPWFNEFTKTSLLNKNQSIPQGEEIRMDDLSVSLHTAKAVWVPNRNGIFLNIAAGFAEGNGCKYVIPGFNFEEAVTFDDNSEDFMMALNHSFKYSTLNHVKVKCYTSHLLKKDIVKLGRELSVPFENIWSCYFGDSKPCGKCESCQRFNRALD